MSKIYGESTEFSELQVKENSMQPVQGKDDKK